MSGERPSRAVRALLYFGTFLLTAVAAGHILSAYGVGGGARWGLSVAGGVLSGLLSEALYLRSFRDDDPSP